MKRRSMQMFLRPPQTPMRLAEIRAHLGLPPNWGEIWSEEDIAAACSLSIDQALQVLGRTLGGILCVRRKMQIVGQPRRHPMKMFLRPTLEEIHGQHGKRWDDDELISFRRQGISFSMIAARTGRTREATKSRVKVLKKRGLL